MPEFSPTVTEPLDGVYDVTWQGPDEGPEVMGGMRWRTYLFDRDGEVPTLVDTSLEARVDALVEGIDRTGVEPERLIVTHEHLDHVGGFDRVVEEYGVETWVPEGLDLQAVSGLDARASPDHEYGDGQRIGRFEAVRVPGHSDCNSALVDERAGVAVCGDTVSGSDRRGLPPGYLIHPPQATNTEQPCEAVVDAEENLRKLLGYDFDVALVNHGSSVFEDASEKLEAYVNYERNYTDPDAPSMHRPDRSGTTEAALYD